MTKLASSLQKFIHFHVVLFQTTSTSVHSHQHQTSEGRRRLQPSEILKQNAPRFIINIVSVFVHIWVLLIILFRPSLRQPSFDELFFSQNLGDVAAVILRVCTSYAPALVLKNHSGVVDFSENTLPLATITNACEWYVNYVIIISAFAFGCDRAVMAVSLTNYSWFCNRCFKWIVVVLTWTLPFAWVLPMFDPCCQSHYLDGHMELLEMKNEKRGLCFDKCFSDCTIAVARAFIYGFFGTLLLIVNYFYPRIWNNLFKTKQANYHEPHFGWPIFSIQAASLYDSIDMVFEMMFYAPVLCALNGFTLIVLYNRYTSVEHKIQHHDSLKLLKRVPTISEVAKNVGARTVAPVGILVEENGDTELLKLRLRLEFELDFAMIALIDQQIDFFVILFYSLYWASYMQFVVIKETFVLEAYYIMFEVGNLIMPYIFLAFCKPLRKEFKAAVRKLFSCKSLQHSHHHHHA